MFDAIKNYFKNKTTKEEAKKYTKVAQEQENTKEAATARGEPWVAVLNTHVNPDNIRNGFFELDWNEYFVLQLKASGYQGTTEEEIVDQWFQDLCRNIGAEEQVDMERRGSGYVSRFLREDGKTEIG